MEQEKKYGKLTEAQLRTLYAHYFKFIQTVEGSPNSDQVDETVIASLLSQSGSFPSHNTAGNRRSKGGGSIGVPAEIKGRTSNRALLVVPVKIGDAVSTVELIDEAGRKSALSGGAKSGGYWAAQTLPEGEGEQLTLLVAEGVATALSGSQATGWPAIFQP